MRSDDFVLAEQIEGVKGALDEIENKFKFIDFTSEGISKKRLFNSGGIGNSLGSVNSHNDWRYVKKEVRAGDVIEITGYATGGDALLWTIVDSEDVIIATETAIRRQRTNYRIVIPEGAAYLVINNYNAGYATPKWRIAKSDSFIEKNSQELYKIEKDVKQSIYQEKFFVGTISPLANKDHLCYSAMGLEVGVDYLISFTFDQQLVSPVYVRMYSAGSYKSSFYVMQKLKGGKSYYEFIYTPSSGYNNQFIGCYNYNSFPLKITVNIFRKGDITKKILELESETTAYGETEVGETVQLPINREYGTYWDYSGNLITERKIDPNNNFTSLDVIDVTAYDKIWIKFYLESAYHASTAFTDDENNIIGGRKYQTNTSAGYVVLNVPEGATRLYVSSRHASISEVGVKVVINEKILSDKVEYCSNSIELLKNISDIFVDYRFDAETGSYFTVVRVHKLKIDGTYQYAHLFAPYGNGKGRWSTLTMNRQFGFAVAINAGIFDVTQGSATIGCPRGTLVVNGEVIQQQESEDTGRKYRFLVIDGNGDLGWREQTVTGAEMVAQGIVDAVAGWEPIVDNYVAIETRCGIGSTAQRQIIGQFGNGDYAIVTSEGRNNMVSDGWTMEEAQSICIGLGLKFAYNLDGGGSTETVVGKKQINTIYEGSAGRVVPTYIVFNGKTTL